MSRALRPRNRCVIPGPPRYVSGQPDKTAPRFDGRAANQHQGRSGGNWSVRVYVPLLCSIPRAGAIQAPRRPSSGGNAEPAKSVSCPIVGRTKGPGTAAVRIRECDCDCHVRTSEYPASRSRGRCACPVSPASPVPRRWRARGPNPETPRLSVGDGVSGVALDDGTSSRRRVIRGAPGGRGPSRAPRGGRFAPRFSSAVRSVRSVRLTLPQVGRFPQSRASSMGKTYGIRTEVIVVGRRFG